MRLRLNKKYRVVNRKAGKAMKVQSLTVYDKMKDVFAQIDYKMQQLGATKIPHFICEEMPSIRAKHQVIVFAKKLGLQPDGKGSLRLTTLAPKFNAAGERLVSWFKGKRYEVYLHLAHSKEYFSAKDNRNLLTLGFYKGS